jgi:CheY-like chemotaxis protein
MLQVPCSIPDDPGKLIQEEYMERADLEQWKSKEVARLLALVETERRYWQEIVSALPVALAVLNPQRYVVSANRTFRSEFNLRADELRTRTIDEVLPGSPEVSELIGTSLVSMHPLSQPLSKVFVRKGVQLRISVLPHRDWDDDNQISLLVAIENLGSAAEVVTPAAIDAPSATPEPAVPAPVAPAAEPVAPTPAPPPAQPVVIVRQAPPGPPPSPAGLPAVAWTLSRETRQFTYLSESISRFLPAVDPKEPAAWPFFERIAESDRAALREHYEHILSQAPAESVFSCEFRLAAVAARWYRETVRVEKDALHGVLVEVSERRTLEEHHIQSQRVDALALIAGRIAHDLNNPLMIVSGYGEELLESFPQNDPRRKDLQQILDAADRLGDLAASLQAFSRRPPSITGNPSALLDLKAELHAAVDRMREAAGSALTVDFAPPASPLLVWAESRGLQTLIFEVTAALSDTPTVHVAIRARAAAIQDMAYYKTPHLAPGSGAVLLIENKGPQLTTQRKSPLFESPLPGKDPSDDSDNTLARAFRHVEAWGGSMWISPDQKTVRILLRGKPAEPVPMTPEALGAPDSPSDEGLAGTESQPPSPADLVTPVVVPAPAPVAPPPPPPPPPPIAKRILVVDDEAGIRSLMRKVLLREGYDVMDAGDATEAMQIVRQQEIDMLLTDVVMPGVNGRELAEQVLHLRPSVKVLYVSGFTGETAVESGSYPPGSELLQKPFTLGSLLRKVKEILE